MTAGHIRKRGKSSWEIRYSFRGERKTATVRGSKKEAERKLRALLDLADRGLTPSKDSCNAWFTSWLAAIRHEVSPVTHAGYTGTVERIFRPAFGDLKLAELDMITIRKTWAELAERLAPASVHVAHRTLSACLSYAGEGGLISSNACANWRKGRGLPALRDREKPALSHSELSMLIDAARDRSDLFAPVVLGAGLGARRGEVCALKWLHVDMQTGDIRIVEALKELSVDNIITGPPKGARSRKVRLPTSYLGLLREWRSIQAQQLLLLGHRVTPEDYICTDEAGRHMTPERLTNLFGALSKRCGLSISFHGLRHTHASLLLEGGESIKTVQLRLGHASPAQTLNVYSHAIRAGADDEADRLDRALQSGPGTAR